MRPVCAILIAFHLPFAAIAQQDDTIRVTTTLRPDGSRVDRQVNPAERTSTETTYDAAGKQTQKAVYKLDDAGNPTEGVAYDAAGKAAMKVSFKRDHTGRLLEQSEFTAAGALIRRLVYEYDATGKVKNIEGFDGAGNRLPKRKQ